MVSRYHSQYQFHPRAACRVRARGENLRRSFASLRPLVRPDADAAQADRLLAVTGRDFGTVDDQLENIDQRVICRVLFCQRHQLFRAMRNKEWVNRLLLDKFSKTCCVTSKSANCGRISNLNSFVARSRRCSGITQTNLSRQLPARRRDNARGARAVSN